MSREFTGGEQGSNKEKIQERINQHIEELRAYGLRGLEGRILRGLDPAGMLAVHETRSIIEKIAKKMDVSMDAVDQLTKELHVGAIWEKADDLKEAEKTEVRMWLLLADACHEVNDQELTPVKYNEDVDRIKGELQEAVVSTDEKVSKAVKHLVGSAREAFTIKDGVPMTEHDAFLQMAICGEKFGVWKDGNTYLVASDKLDFTVLEDEGLTPVQKEERGRMLTFYQRDGVDVAKQKYPGLGVVMGDEALALRLAKTAEKYFSKES